MSKILEYEVTFDDLGLLYDVEKDMYYSADGHKERNDDWGYYIAELGFAALKKHPAFEHIEGFEEFRAKIQQDHPLQGESDEGWGWLMTKYDSFMFWLNADRYCIKDNKIRIIPDNFDN
jgi:hypothetical protein